MPTPEPTPPPSRSNAVAASLLVALLVALVLGVGFLLPRPEPPVPEPENPTLPPPRLRPHVDPVAVRRSLDAYAAARARDARLYALEVKGLGSDGQLASDGEATYRYLTRQGLQTTDEEGRSRTVHWFALRLRGGTVAEADDRGPFGHDSSEVCCLPDSLALLASVVAGLRRTQDLPRAAVVDGTLAGPTLSVLQDRRSWVERVSSVWPFEPRWTLQVRGGGRFVRPAVPEPCPSRSCQPLDPSALRRADPMSLSPRVEAIARTWAADAALTAIEASGLDDAGFLRPDVAPTEAEVLWRFASREKAWGATHPPWQLAVRLSTDRLEWVPLDGPAPPGDAGWWNREVVAPSPPRCGLPALLASGRRWAGLRPVSANAGRSDSLTRLGPRAGLGRSSALGGRPQYDDILPLPRRRDLPARAVGGRSGLGRGRGRAADRARRGGGTTEGL